MYCAVAMQNKPDSFEAILAHWDSHKSLSLALGVPYVNAQAMRKRRSVSVDHWPRLIELLAAKGIHITNDDLVQMTLKRREAA